MTQSLEATVNDVSEKDTSNVDTAVSKSKFNN